MRNKLLSKHISQIKNLNESSFENKNKIVLFHKLPPLNHNKSESYFKPLNFYSSETNFPISNRRKMIPESNINRGIVWLKDEYFKTPKLILSCKNNSFKSSLSERHLVFSKRYKRMKLNKSFIFSNKYFQQFNKMIKTKEVNEVLGLKKAKSMLDIKNEQMKEESEIDRYIRKLGIWLDERDLKTVLVSRIKGKRNSIFEQYNNHKSKINLFNKSLIMKKKNENESEEKAKNNKSYVNILNRNKRIIKKKILKEEELKTPPRKLILVQKKVEKFDNIFKKISNKMVNLFVKKKNEFEKFIEDEFPLKIE